MFGITEVRGFRSAIKNNKNMKYSIITLLVALLLSSCVIPSRFQVSGPGQDLKKVKASTMYSLPQTSFLVTIEYEKEMKVPGPYWRYSEKLLGMVPEIREAGTTYGIGRVEVKPVILPDTDHYYRLNVLRGTLPETMLARLAGNGFLMDPSVLPAFSIDHPEFKKPGGISLDELAVSLNLKEVTDTLYKTMLMDSSYVRVPVLRRQVVAKTLDQKAEETAHFIIKIRKRRFKLLAGEYEIFPEGKALEISVRELDQLEREYLELFLGKTVTEKFQKSYLVQPSAGKGEQSIAFAKFSEKEGLLPMGSPTGSELVLAAAPSANHSVLQTDTAGFTSSPGYNEIIYRLPSMSVVHVRLADQDIYEGRFPVFQAGDFVVLKDDGKP